MEHRRDKPGRIYGTIVNIFRGQTSKGHITRITVNFPTRFKPFIHPEFGRRRWPVRTTLDIAPAEADLLGGLNAVGKEIVLNWVLDEKGEFHFFNPRVFSKPQVPAKPKPVEPTLSRRLAWPLIGAGGLLAGLFLRGKGKGSARGIGAQESKAVCGN